MEKRAAEVKNRTRRNEEDEKIQKTLIMGMEHTDTKRFKY